MAYVVMVYVGMAFGRLFSWGDEGSFMMRVLTHVVRHAARQLCMDMCMNLHFEVIHVPNCRLYGHVVQR